MKIETKRCTIRKFEEKDIESFMLYRNDKSWMRYQGFKGLSKEEYKKALLPGKDLNNGVQLAIILNETNELIGDVYLVKKVDELWVGYTISPQYSRKGFAFEAVQGLIKWAAGQGFLKVFAGVVPENIASINLLKKARFIFVGSDEDGEDIYALEI